MPGSERTSLIKRTLDAFGFSDLPAVFESVSKAFVEDGQGRIRPDPHQLIRIIRGGSPDSKTSQAHVLRASMEVAKEIAVNPETRESPNLDPITANLMLGGVLMALDRSVPLDAVWQELKAAVEGEIPSVSSALQTRVDEILQRISPHLALEKSRKPTLLNYSHFYKSLPVDPGLLEAFILEKTGRPVKALITAAGRSAFAEQGTPGGHNQISRLALEPWRILYVATETGLKDTSFLTDYEKEMLKWQYPAPSSVIFEAEAPPLAYPTTAEREAYQNVRFFGFTQWGRILADLMNQWSDEELYSTLLDYDFITFRPQGLILKVRSHMFGMTRRQILYRFTSGTLQRLELHQTDTNWVILPEPAEEDLRTNLLKIVQRLISGHGWLFLKPFKAFIAHLGQSPESYPKIIQAVEANEYKENDYNRILRKANLHISTDRVHPFLPGARENSIPGIIDALYKLWMQEPPARHPQGSTPTVLALMLGLSALSAGPAQAHPATSQAAQPQAHTSITAEIAEIKPARRKSMRRQNHSEPSQGFSLLGSMYAIGGGSPLALISSVALK